MAKAFLQGVCFRSITGRLAGVTMYPARRQTAGYRPPKATLDHHGNVVATVIVLRKAESHAIGEAWKAAHQGEAIPVGRLIDFGRDLASRVQIGPPAAFGGPLPETVKARTLRPGEIQTADQKGPKSLDKPMTDPKKSWWTSPPTFKAPCHAQKICDIAYQALTPAHRNLWRAACTPLYRTPYDVYMHYNIPRVLRGVPGPAVPPERAGWKTRGIAQYPDYFHNPAPLPFVAYPDASCQTWGLSFVHVQFAKRLYYVFGEPRIYYGTLWTIWAHVGLPDNPDQGFLDITVYEGRRGGGKSETFTGIWWPIMETNPIWHDIKPHSASLTWRPARRHSDGSLYWPPIPDPVKKITVRLLTTSWAWGHYRLPYPSPKCTTGSMSEYIKSWQPGEGETITPYI